MKKLLAIVLMLGLLLTLTACGTINDNEVAVLWSGSETAALVPNSQINAVDRAMYIENIAYKHYAASGDQAAQTKQAEDALNAGCAALMVELVDVSAAQTIVDLAKAKDVPVVFFGCEVAQEVLASYGKAAAVITDEATLGATYGKMIGEYVVENIDVIDRNDDGVVSYCAVGDVSMLVEEAEKVLAAEAEKEAEEKVVTSLSKVEGPDMAAVLAVNNDEGGNMIELVISGSDESALTVLGVLQGIDYNTTRLKTHCIPLFTVGADADASAFTDTSAMNEEELSQLIYNAMNVIDAGQMAGTAMEDYDGIAVAAADLVSRFLKGEEVTETLVAVPYTIYTK